ncbi:MAG: hypothetical protein CML29_10655 [Rhizobiales bacterium]|nr:hypothetical protein [Hyphomicrobiales bacterium]MBA67910.1 hypothetical protein [Hyphomicrobiales bacterium]
MFRFRLFLQQCRWSSSIRDIKKGPLRSLFSRMGAFAGWLRHPAHARSYYENACNFHHGSSYPLAVRWSIRFFHPPDQSSI